MNTDKNVDKKAAVKEKLDDADIIFVYLKNTKCVPVKGTIIINEDSVIVTSEENVSTFNRTSIAVLIRDVTESEKALYDLSKDPSGFEIISLSATAVGFNGWCVDEGIYISDEDDLVTFYEPIDYIQKGPQQEVSVGKPSKEKAHG